MSMSIYIYMYIFIHVHTYIHIHMYVYKYIFMYVEGARTVDIDAVGGGFPHVPFLELRHLVQG